MKHLKLLGLFSFSALLISCGQNKEAASNVGLFEQEGTTTQASTSGGGGTSGSGGTTSGGTSGSGGTTSGGSGTTTTYATLDFNRAFTIVEDSGYGLEGNYANIQEFSNAVNAASFSSCIYAKRQGDTTGTSQTYLYLGFGPCLTILFTQN